jgi:hypothetical protein
MTPDGVRHVVEVDIERGCYWHTGHDRERSLTRGLEEKTLWVPVVVPPDLYSLPQRMACAVLQGDEIAALALADILMESRAGKVGGG